MPLEIIKTVRNALMANEALRQSDVQALCATAEQLWQQIVDGQRARAISQHRRDYMREYMRRYRSTKRQDRTDGRGQEH